MMDELINTIQEIAPSFKFFIPQSPPSCDNCIFLDKHVTSDNPNDVFYGVNVISVCTKHDVVTFGYNKERLSYSALDCFVCDDHKFPKDE